MKKPPFLLVEVRTEELPPAVLWDLADSFADSLLALLRQAGFADEHSARIKADSGSTQKLATPRRLAALLQNIRPESAAREVVRRGPQVSACYDQTGAPTKALLGFMHSVGATCEKDLTQTREKNKTHIAWRGTQPGVRLQHFLPAAVEKVLLGIRAPRLMRWGDNDFKFVRPVRGVLMMHGDEIIGGTIMNIRAASATAGHPALAPAELPIKSAEQYAAVMHDTGKVLVDMERRRQSIRRELENKEFGRRAFVADAPEDAPPDSFAGIGGERTVSPEAPLLREVTAMGENPTCHWRQIDEAFMTLPHACIALCMKKNQRFFPFYGDDHVLLRDYCLVADNRPNNSAGMLRGYDEVLRARLRDLKFYYAEDKKISLAAHVEKLKTITFHQKLGSQHDRIGRVCKIAAALAPQMGMNCGEAEIKQTAEKFLAPLPTLMAGEYPELQEYLSEIYFGRERLFACVCLCYDWEKLAAMLGAGERPTGSKDPHGLRRNALNIARSLAAGGALNMREIIAVTVESFAGKIADVHDEMYDFIWERMRFLLSAHYSAAAVDSPPEVIEAVLSQKPADFSHIRGKIDALRNFCHDPAAKTLTAAGKRVNNILRKSGVDEKTLPATDESLFAEVAERELWTALQGLRKRTAAHMQENNFSGALQTLAATATPVDNFFDHVLVNAEDEKTRRNRFALLKELRGLLNCVADISRLP